VQFIIKHDHHAKFRFTSLQSKIGIVLLQKHGLPAGSLNTVVYIRNEKHLIKSEAALYILKDMGGIWSLFFGFIIIPGFIRNFFYDLIARSRKTLFGKSHSCLIPSPDNTKRLL